jgi:hypothetical protein
MSTPTTRPTRQQLDELDALLQRMLSLPGSTPEPEYPPPPAQASSVPASAGVTSAVGVSPPSLPAATPPVVNQPLVTAVPSNGVATGPASPQFGPSALPTTAAPTPPQAPNATPIMVMPPPPPPPPPPRLMDPAMSASGGPVPAGAGANPSGAMQPPPTRKAAPPSGTHLWNVPLPANSGGASFPTWPAGIESLTAAAASPIAHAVPPPQSPASPGKLTVTPMVAPQPHAGVSHVPHAPSMNGNAPSVTTSPPTFAPLPVYRAESPLPFYLWPLGFIDQVCGSMMSAFGPPGRWLGQGSGKVLVGWAGLLMIVGAAAWGVMDYFGMSW